MRVGWGSPPAWLRVSQGSPSLDASPGRATETLHKIKDAVGNRLAKKLGIHAAKVTPDPAVEASVEFRDREADQHSAAGLAQANGSGALVLIEHDCRPMPTACDVRQPVNLR